MAIDANDLVESILDEQARVNAAVEAGDINYLVVDALAIAGEVVGATETLTTSTTAPPHKWGDAQSPWGFFSWA